MIQTEDLPIIPLPDDLSGDKSVLEVLKGLSLDDALSYVANGVVRFAFNLLIAAIVFYVGKYVIKRIYEIVNRILQANDVDASLTSFILSVVRIVLYFLLIITIVDILGIETSSFLALFATASVAVGMALSGTLQNFAGGVLILLLKPYKIGDFIEAQGFTGTVKEIQIFHTIINTMDNKTIIIPNGGLSTGSINNYSLEEYRRVDWEIGLTYGFDFNEAKKLILEMLLSDDRVVSTTLQNDMDQRKIIETQTVRKIPEVDCPEDDPDCDPEEELKKMNWFKRFRIRRKIRQRQFKEKIKKNTSISLPANLDVERPPFVAIKEMADSSVVLAIRAWTQKANYWNLYFDMNERFYKELPQHGFDFPFPQLDVHVTDIPGNLQLK